jgi:hypothetical protein
LAGEELQGLSTAYHCRQSRGCFIFGSIASLLYEWISSQIRSSGNMSYVKHQRVCLQLDDHPDHTEWTLLGSNYVIIRRGAILMVKWRMLLKAQLHQRWLASSWSGPL